MESNVGKLLVDIFFPTHPSWLGYARCFGGGQVFCKKRSLFDISVAKCTVEWYILRMKPQFLTKDLSEYVDYLQSRGDYVFSEQAAVEVLQCSDVAFRARGRCADRRFSGCNPDQ